MRGAPDEEGFPVPLKHLFPDHAESSGFAASVISRTRVATKDADLPFGGQFRIDLADGFEEGRVNGRIPGTICSLRCGLPDLRQLIRGNVLASNVTVKNRLFCSAAELHDDAANLLRKIGSANQCDSQIGFLSEFPVCLAQRQDVGLIECDSERFSGFIFNSSSQFLQNSFQ